MKKRRKFQETDFVFLEGEIKDLSPKQILFSQEFDRSGETHGGNCGRCCQEQFWIPKKLVKRNEKTNSGCFLWERGKAKIKIPRWLFGSLSRRFAN